MRPILLLLIAFLPSLLAGQNNMNLLRTGVYKNATLYTMLHDVVPKYNLRLCVDPDKLPWYQLDYSFRDKTLHEALTGLLPRHGLGYIMLNDSLVGVCQRPDMQFDYLTALREQCLAGAIEPPEFLRPVKLDITLGQPGKAAGRVEVRLTILDEDTREAIVGAVAQLDGQRQSAPSDATGQTRFDLPAGQHRVVIQYLGYRETQIRLAAWESGAANVLLKGTPELLQEVEIRGNQAANKLRTAQTAVEALPVQTIRELPAFMGEADVLKSLNTLPGVSSAGEGASGFNVRGGNVDQNLMLQDQAPLFNATHVLGLFSTYNPDAVQNVTLYKGHVPARFGGRVASVLDVQLKDGNYSEFHGNVGIGVVTGKALLEGPILRNRVSFIAGYRQSYATWLLKSLSVRSARESRAGFADGLAKISVRLPNQGSLSVSVFQSSDELRYRQEFGYRWTNRVANAIWRRPIGARLVSVVQGNAGLYRAAYFVPEGLDAFNLENGLRYANLSWRTVFNPDKGQEINAGLQWERLVGLDETVGPTGNNSVVQPRTVAKDRGETYALFVEDDYRLNDRWSASAGLRGVYYRQFGPSRVYEYRPEAPLTPGNILDSSAVSGQTLYDAWGLEPRVSIKYQVSENQALKLSYNRIHQFTHLISNLTAPTPTDIWQTSTRYIRPQQSDNFNIGYTLGWREQTYEFSADVFYKTTRRVPVYRNFPTLLLNQHLETELTPGHLRTYGLELALRRQTGRLTGWFSYTYARAIMTADGPFAEDQVNRGAPFPSDYDQPHQINVYLRYSTIPSYYLAVGYTYRTGRPVTQPSGIYQVGNIIVPDYSERNNYRIPDYHRVDISFNRDQNKSKISGLRTSINISIYNLLARKNPYTVFFQKRPSAPPAAYSLSLLGTAIPSITITFTF